MTNRQRKLPEPVTVFTDGSGARPDGKGSGFAWIRQDTGEKHIQRQDGLTNNEAEYMAVLAALEVLPNGTVVEVLCDSSLVANQFCGVYNAVNARLVQLLSNLRDLISRKKLDVNIRWIRRQENLAGRLL